MFDLLSDAFDAWNQIFFIIGGLVFVAFAVFMVVATIQQRRRSVKVRGRIVAVRCGGIVSGMEGHVPKEEPEEEKPQESFGALARKSPGSALGAIIFVALIALVPLSFIGFAGYSTWSYYDLQANGIRTDARVDDIYADNSDEGTMYSIVAAYKDEAGKSYRVKDKIGTSHRPPWREGSTVAIFYDPQDPERFVVDAFWHNMALPIIFSGMGGGVLFLFVGWPLLNRNKKPKTARPAVKKERMSMTEAVSRYYYPVYEYVTPQGETMRAHSSTGGNSLSDKMPGTKVMLLVGPDEPWDAEKPGFLWFALAVIFGVPGVVLLYLAFTKFAFNIFTVAFSGLLVSVIVYKIVKVIKPREQWETKSAFKDRRREARRKKMENPPGRILEDHELRLRADAIDRYNRAWLPVLFLIAFGFLGGGYYYQYDLERFSLNALRTEGEVTSLQDRTSPTGDGSIIYYPVVSYVNEEGKTKRFQDRVGGNPAPFQVGERVPVRYNPDPPHRSTIDRGLLNSFPALICYGFGALMLWASFRSFIGIRRRRGRL